MSFSALLKDFKAKPKRSADDAEHPAPKRAKAPADAEEDDGAPEAGPVSRGDADPLPPLVFQIGMNKTGTSSICNLANACFGPGHCVHFTVGDGADGEVPIARRMVENERAGRSLLAGFDLAPARMFTDMEDMRPERGEGAVEGYRRFWRRLRDEHPDARFVLNVRVVGDEAEAPSPSVRAQRARRGRLRALASRTATTLGARARARPHRPPRDRERNARRRARASPRGPRRLRRLPGSSSRVRHRP